MTCRIPPSKSWRAKVLGLMALGFRRTFYWDGEVFEMRLPTRGFHYELDLALPVETCSPRNEKRTRCRKP